MHSSFLVINEVDKAGINDAGGEIPWIIGVP